MPRFDIKTGRNIEIRRRSKKQEPNVDNSKKFWNYGKTGRKWEIKTTSLKFREINGVDNWRQ
mgnify:CR=1 FL=1